jgi:hypothetical protein
LTRNQPDLLPRCVASCLAEIERAGITSEIIVVDNASCDASPQKTAKLSPLIRLVRNEENLGFSEANNIGIRMSRGGYVLILNDDTEFHPGALGLLVRVMDADPRIGAVGPKLLNPDGSLQRGSTRKRFPHLVGLVSELLRFDFILEKFPATRDLLTNCCDEERGGDAEHLTAACLLARRAALDAVGLFDEGFYFFFEDVDLCYRLKNAGWRLLYCPEAQVTHYQSASFKKLVRARQSEIYLGGMIRFFRKHSSPGRFLLFKLTLAFTLCLRLPVAVMLSVSLPSGVRQQWKGIVQTYLKVLRSLLLP